MNPPAQPDRTDVEGPNGAATRSGSGGSVALVPPMAAVGLGGPPGAQRDAVAVEVEVAAEPAGAGRRWAADEPSPREEPAAARRPSWWWGVALAGVGGAVSGGAAWLVGGWTAAAAVAAASGSAAGGAGWAAYALGRRVKEERREVQRLLGRGASDSLWTWLPARNEAWFSPRWEALFGIRPGAGADLGRWLDRVHPGDRDRLVREVTELAAGTRDVVRVVHRLYVHGAWRWVDVHAVAARSARGDNIIAGSLEDVTERRETEARLAHNAYHDALTDLPNRALFVDRLAHALARARRNPRYTFAVLFLDVDSFKVINDSLGHASGDALLAIVANRLKTCIRPADTVARIGGDEFTVLLDPCESVEQAEHIAERLIHAVRGTFEVRGHLVQTSVSVGVALSNRRYEDPHELLRDADTAMYRAKRTGKGRHRVFDLAMHTTAMRRLKLESELSRAIERGDLVVHYQPIVALATGRIEGFEALVRLPTEGGLVSPGEFIPIAEESGIIDAVLEHVLHTAAARVAEWRVRHPGLYVSVNVSGRSVNPFLLEQVEQVLTRQRLEPDGLKLELTESVLVDSGGDTAQVLNGLRDLGVGLYIDDFGTGYSSLSYMHQFAIERLKIDRSFVSALDGQRMPSIVETIIDLSGRLSAGVIAEGIETDAQLNVLRAMGCTHGQGFRFSPALAARDAVLLLEAPRDSW